MRWFKVQPALPDEAATGDEAQLDAPTARRAPRWPCRAGRRGCRSAPTSRSRWPAARCTPCPSSSPRPGRCSWRWSRCSPGAAARCTRGARRRSGSPSAPPGSAPARGGCTSACTATAACRRRWPRWRCSALCAVLSLYLAAAMALFAHGAPRRPLADALRFAACWLLAELARGVLFTGFPWIASGYAHIDGPLAALAPWVGVYGMGFVAALVGALLVPRRALWRGRRSLVPPLAALAAAGAAGRRRARALHAADRHARRAPCCRPTCRRTRSSRSSACRRRSPGCPSGCSPRKGDARRRARDRHPAAARAARRRPTGSRCVQRFTSGAQAALIGLPLGSYERGYTNSVVGLSREAAAERAGRGASDEGLPPGSYRYDKHHLVPFGEFIPTGFHWFTEMMNIPLGDFSRGPLAAPSFAVRRPARRAQHLLRGPVRRGAGGALRRCRHGADHLRQRQQHRLVRRHRRHPAAPRTSRGCARSNSSARCCARPTPARPR